ncbi:MAG: oligosaccharide flippase family protein [Synechococcaceae cyanobacterium]|nr:oligosaccharide flippase family protein [Synechococcaceae cyanobacterium]
MGDASPQRPAGRWRRLSREGFWVLAGQVASFIGALALVRLLTDRISPFEYGRLALGLTLAGLVNQVIVGGLTLGIGRFQAIASEARDAEGFLKASAALMARASAAVLALAAAVCLGMVLAGQTPWLPLSLVVFGYALSSGWSGAIATLQNAARQRGVVAVHTGLEPWLRLLLIAFSLRWLGPSAVAVAWGYTIASLLVTVSQLRWLGLWWRRERRRAGALPADPGRWRREIWAYSWPLSTWGLFSWAQQSSDRWALERFASSADVAQYVVLFQLGYAPLSMVSGLVASLLGPVLFQRAGAADDAARTRDVHRLTWRVSLVGLLASAGLTALALLLHRPLFQLLVAADFRPISIYLPWLVLAGCLFTIGQILALKLMAEKRSEALKVVKINTCIGATGLNILGAKFYGMPGVVGAVVLFSLVYFVWMLLLCRSTGSSGALPATPGNPVSPLSA